LRDKNLEGAIWADVSALLAEPKRIADEYERRLNIGSDPKEAPSQRKLQMHTSRVQRQISKLIDAYSEGLIEKREFEPRIRDARAHLEQLRSEMVAEEIGDATFDLQARLNDIQIQAIEALDRECDVALDDIGNGGG
jgi:site-specific DNA recombinase